MTKRSKGYNHSASKAVATIGNGSSVPVKSTVSFKGAKEGSYQNTSRVSYGDKQSGRYGSVTNKEKASAGEFQWKNGTTGTKSEYKQSSTVRFGDNSGYTEVHNEQRVRNVAYDKSNCNNKNYITYDSEDDGSYGGYGYDDEDDGSDGGSGYDDEDDGLCGGSDYDDEDDGSCGGSYYDDEDEDEDDGSDGGCGYDSDY